MNRYIIGHILLLLMFSCTNKKEDWVKKEYYSNGKLHSKSFYFKDRPSFRYVENFDSTGFCIEKLEYNDSLLDGRCVFYNSLTNSVLVQYFEKGRKHGVGRFVNATNSYERLVLRDTMVILKVYGEIAKKNNNKVDIGHGYAVLKTLDDKIIYSQGQIVLKGDTMVSIFDIDIDHVDVDQTDWYFDDLSDTIPKLTDVWFNINLSTSNLVKPGLSFHSAQIVLGNFDANLMRLDNKPWDKYKGVVGQNRISCKVNIHESGYNLLTGIIQQNYLDDKLDTTYLYKVYYKQIFAK